jgi:hypothetical protein
MVGSGQRANPVGEKKAAHEEPSKLETPAFSSKTVISEEHLQICAQLLKPATLTN